MTNLKSKTTGKLSCGEGSYLLSQRIVKLGTIAGYSFYTSVLEEHDEPVEFESTTSGGFNIIVQYVLYYLHLSDRLALEYFGLNGRPKVMKPLAESVFIKLINDSRDLNERESEIMKDALWDAFDEANRYYAGAENLIQACSAVVLNSFGSKNLKYLSLAGKYCHEGAMQIRPNDILSQIEL